MTRLRMTKAALAERRRALEAYRRALPSLRLKRQQFARELERERDARGSLAGRLADRERAARDIPFAADSRIQIEALLALDRVEQAVELRLGVALPRLVQVHWTVADYRFEATPPWLELALDAIREAAEARLALAVADARVAALAAGLRRAVQRVNLLEQRLMPEARADIARIGQFLADAERTALARAKLAMRQIAARSADSPGADREETA